MGEEERYSGYILSPEIAVQIYAWSNNKHKPPRLGHKWSQQIGESHGKKWLWTSFIGKYPNGEVVILEPAKLNERAYKEG